MSKINLGKVSGNKYKKMVSFSKAVLWKNRQISLKKEIAETMPGEVQWIEFEDRGKQEIWLAPFDQVKSRWILKKEGQEPQYYIPIEIFRKYKGTDYVSYKSGVKRVRWDKEAYEKKELERGILNAQTKLLI